MLMMNGGWFNCVGNAEGVNYIVESNEAGKGIDIWFTLKLTRSRGYLLVGDQRKRVVDSTASSTVNDCVREALAVAPKNIEDITKTVIGVFSMWSSVTALSLLDGMGDLPDNCFVVSQQQLPSYHGQFTHHPASSPVVQILHDKQSTLELLDVVSDGGTTGKLSGKDAKWIATNRAYSRWGNVSDLISAMRRSGSSVKSFIDAERIRFD
jgi:hypothetical protein